MPSHTHVYVAAVIVVLILSVLGIMLRLLSIRNKRKERKASQRVFERTAGFPDSIGSRYRGSPSTDTHLNDGSHANQRGFVSRRTSSPTQAPTSMPAPRHEIPSIRSHPSTHRSHTPAINRSSSRARSPRRASDNLSSPQIPTTLSLEDGSTNRELSPQPNQLTLVERMREVQLLIMEIQRLEGQANREGNRDKIQTLQQRITELSDTHIPFDDNHTNTFAFPMPNIISEPPPAYQRAP
ncbi:hypothetical protein BJ165DRAFT_728570 [Panaeolus papilionaceus]|nr:hypothetical protein BJ165DRAFT_728570 [Panaeolus papilionaceus]